MVVSKKQEIELPKDVAATAGRLSSMPPTAGRSIAQFDLDVDEDDLRMALMNMEIKTREDAEGIRDSCEDDRDGCDAGEITNNNDDNHMVLDDNWDWTLTNYDVERTIPQTIQYEVQRLKILQSYKIVGDESDVDFDRLTNMAGRIFGVPMAMVVLIDLGRTLTWHSLGKAIQAPRKTAFCAHTIMNTQEILQIPDTTLDFRFKGSEYVAGPPYIRFYAGAPLITPEGFRLGTFCIIDMKPWPNGLSPDQKQTLQDFSATVMRTITDRAKLKQKVQKKTSAMIANTANELMTPLSGVQAYLGKLRNDATSQLAPRHQACLATACTGLELVKQICDKTRQELEVEEQEHDDESTTRSKGKNRKNVVKAIITESLKNNEKGSSVPVPPNAPKSSSNKKQQHTDDKMLDSKDFFKPSSYKKQQQQHIDDDNIVDTKDFVNDSIVDMKDFVKRLHRIIDPVPKTVPLVITMEPQVPLRIVSDELKILRATLNVLSNACAKSTRGKIHFRIFLREKQLVFECQQEQDPTRQNKKNITSKKRNNKDMKWRGRQEGCPFEQCGNNTAINIAKHTEMSDVALNSLHDQVESLKGHHGYQTYSLLLPAKGESAEVPQEGGSYFWFSIPMREPPEPVLEDAQEVTDTIKDQTIEDTRDLCSTDTGNSNGNKQKRSALIIEDSIVVRNALARALTRLGFEATTASDGVEGLNQLKNQYFDFALCDFIMPNMDGIECVSQYRQWEQEHRPQQRRYIIGISAHASPNDVTKGLQAGMDEYICKPITRKVMKELVGKIDIDSDSILDSREQSYKIPQQQVLSCPPRPIRSRDVMEMESSTVELRPSSIKRRKLTNNKPTAGTSSYYNCMPNA